MVHFKGRHVGGRNPRLEKVGVYGLPQSSFNCPIGERLYAAHAHYGQAIADFCERAVHIGQCVDWGELWDMETCMYT